MGNLVVSRPDPAISVLLPVFDAECTLEQAAASILAQDETDLELVVVDDGSTDGTPAVLRSLARQDARVRVESMAHGGIVAALSRGLARCRGRYIARMDADDVSYPGRLQAQRRHLDRHPGVGLVSCRVDFGGEGGGDRGYAHHVAWTNTVLTREAISLGRFIESPLAHPSVMFRSELVEAYGGYREGPFPEDYDLWLRWLEQGVVMEKFPETLLRWNDPADRLSRIDPRCSVEAFYRCKTGYLARWLGRENPHHPEVVVWGGGRTTRKRAALLEDHGVRITAYVDVDPRKIGQRIGGKPVLAPDQLPLPGRVFVLPYVGSWDAREKITAWLDARGYRAGSDYICAA